MASKVSADWRIEESFDRTGAYHMERDEELARERIDQPDLPNILRLYSWQPHAVSTGYQQSMDAIDLEACAQASIDVVRRPTGGRAVLHANELTYAVIMRANTGIYHTHNLIVRALLKSFETLSASARGLDLTGGQTNIRAAYAQGTLTNAACFASSARHEATFEGRKVIGSAQRRFGDVVLQHGSILLTTDHMQLPSLLRLSEENRARMHALLERETATLADVCGRPISIAEAGFAVRERFVPEICELLACQEPAPTAPA
ncbi:MAG: lipoate--protein ligase family protein [Bacteroidota bacterium]|nr:lipoate--protein ligase family protein [Bacteroidota bacterium]MDP4231813.1 lipoate--protein ligase family protein [Bacteroidota bacterium]MDP4242699.1 lipoate--protein ligase family protein [Bacteroidota bacterium]MDP4287150.1 lipoate--protein ligase family protein [Bacteroidota bacterium]